ncbi:hypothetical protein Godav_025754 [Gossypium davidsonii]|uniref:DUF4283 domain-containing protein n=2 Tax=Gossypium TaxID=3633 RepID=A0A7J8TH94_GOSDV|nr:hypothetical protein [Gossypium davidsonii]MBA0660668.1 hypothetical protein [Gossypium klotzschianum]
MEVLANEIVSKDIRGAMIIRYSGFMVLLVFENEKKMEYLMAKQIETLDNWFLRLQRWSEKIIIDSQRAWLACRRIPIHAWNMVAFQNIGERWGEFIFVDSGTLYPILSVNAVAMIAKQNSKAMEKDEMEFEKSPSDSIADKEVNEDGKSLNNLAWVALRRDENATKEIN